MKEDLANKPALVSRVYVDGELVSTRELSLNSVDDDVQADVVTAMDTDKPWHIEVADIDTDKVLSRFGTDGRFMQRPMAMPDEVGAEVASRIASRIARNRLRDQ